MRKYRIIIILVLLSCSLFIFKNPKVFPAEFKIPFLFSGQADEYPNIRPCGFIHSWGRYDRTKGPNHGDHFDVARARFGLMGNFTPDLSYLLLTEWGKLTYNDPTTLLDAWVNLRVNPAFNIKIGQTWYKFTRSGTEILPKIPFIYRPEVVDAIWLPMGRNGSYAYDRGIELWGNLKEGFLPLGYAFSVTAGSGLDNFEDNGKKDLVGRFWVEPIKGLQLGVSGFSGYSRLDVASNLRNLETKDLSEYAWATELAYSNEHFRFIYEYLQALYEGYSDVRGSEIFHLATKKPRGWYAMFGVKPLPWIEIPVRYAWYEKDSTKSDTGLHSVTVGVTLFLKEGTLNNLKLNYIIRSAEANYGSKPRNMFAAQLQFVF